MRKKYPKKYESRTKTKFLLFPKRIGTELRWLETASWREEFVPEHPILYPNNLDGYWRPLKWI
jgi:hypothetical protein